jgi:heat shock protein HspQ
MPSRVAEKQVKYLGLVIEKDAEYEDEEEAYDGIRR